MNLLAWLSGRRKSRRFIDIDHRLRVVSAIGQGGFAHADLVLDRQTGRFYVAKRSLHPDRLDEGDAFNLKAELNKALSVDHLNVASAHPYFYEQEDGGIYILTEFCEGPTLGTLVRHAARHVLDSAIDETMCHVPRAPWTNKDKELSDDPSETTHPCRTGKRAMRLDGFSLHANTAAAADNRVGLEKLCRYGMRPPFSQQRLSLEGDGRVRLDLKRPWPNADGATSLIFEPVEFLRRLAALIPPPFAHLIRYHGLFAPRARDRDRLPAAPVTDVRLEAWARAGLLEPAQDSSKASKENAQPDKQAPNSPVPTPGAQTGPGAAPTPGGLDVQPSSPGVPIAPPSMNPSPAVSLAAPTPSSPHQGFVLTGQRKHLRWRDLLRRSSPKMG